LILRQVILKRLAEVGFRTGEGTIAPFGQPLPLVTAWATDESTASLALIVEDASDVADDEPWRELLFALSGLRHELQNGGSPALGTPVVVALLQNDESAHRLRRLIEELGQQYVLFSRIELNVVVATGRDPIDSNVDVALAPLLPRSRKALMQGTVIDRETLRTLGDELKDAVRKSVATLPELLRPSALGVAESYAERLAGLITASASADSFAPTTWDSVHLRDFRAFADQEIPLGSLTLVEGLNGTGKSSLVEALELLWTGTSQRKPPDETAANYDEHLARGGNHAWSITGYRRTVDGEAVSQTVSESGSHTPGALARNVFSQDGSLDIAREKGTQRYEELLRITGLAIPELLEECERLNREAKSQLDSLLARLQIAPTKSINARSLEHVSEALRSVAGGSAPSASEVTNLQTQLVEEAKSHGLVFQPFETATLSAEAVETLQRLAEDLAGRLQSSEEFTGIAQELHEVARRSAVRAESNARSVDALIAAVAARRRPAEQATPFEDGQEVTGLPAQTASTWLYAGRSLRQSINDLRKLDVSSAAPTWRTRLERFLVLADEALGEVPFVELERFIQGRPASSPPALAKEIDPAVLLAAGFEPSSVTDLPQTVQDLLRQLANSLRDHGTRLSAFAEAILLSPLVLLEGHEETLNEAVAQFELAKALKKPVSGAQAELLTRLISGPLEPLFVELIMALTRFEWYFRPPKMTVRRGAVGFYGLATDSDKLDVRMLLNAGERAIVTLAWFLALHLLQPLSQRKILVLDDPFSTLDENNQAALVATLRTFARLTRPEMLLISTHDRVVADIIERDFAAIDRWPATVAKLRFTRSPDDTTVANGDVEETPRADYARELARLGLPGEAQPAGREHDRV
jgi:energy-coupling factor transporter ATP-binding protein EcfA2